jgi:hypothetical protein
MLRPGERPDRWEAAGTSSHYAVVTGDGDRAIEVTVVGPPDAELQVTAVALPLDLNRLELSVRPISGEDGNLTVQATVRHGGDQLVRLSTLAWEPLVPPADPHRPGFHLGRLDGPQLEPMLGTLAPPAASSLRTRPITLSGVRPESCPVILKLIGTDARGRRLAAWAVVDGPDDPAAADASGPFNTRTR